MKLLGELEVLDYLIEEKGMTELTERLYDTVNELLRLNPQDEDVLVFASRFHVYDINDFDRGVYLAERAMEVHSNTRTIMNYFELLSIKESCD